MKNNKTTVILVVSTVVMAILAIAGWSVAIYDMNVIKERDATIADLAAKSTDLGQQVEDMTAVEDKTANKIVVENWGVEFPYTTGVTKVKSELVDVFDGAVRIKSIEVDGETYDAKTCSNDENAFIGEVVRFNNESDDDSKSPEKVEDTYDLIFKSARYSYYINRNIKNDCAKSDEMKKGISTAYEILRSIKMNG